MIKYIDVLNDKYIQDLLIKIDEYEEKDYENAWCSHGGSHLLKVIHFISKIMEGLKCSKEEIELGKIAGLLHDIGCIEGKKNHSTRSYNMAKEYLESKEIECLNKEKILNAILDHGSGDNIQSTIGAALLIADKIDIDKTRLLGPGRKVEGVREIGNIEQVELKIQNKTITIKLTSNKDFKIQELRKWYFLEKIESITKKASKYLGLKAVFEINGIVTNLM